MKNNIEEVRCTFSRDQQSLWTTKRVLVLLLLFIPFINGSVLYFQSIGVLETIGLNRAELVQKFLWTKILPDLAFVGILLSFLYWAVARRMFCFSYVSMLLVFITIVIVNAFTTAITNPLRMVVGIRYFSSILLFFVAFNTLSDRDLKFIGQTVVVLGVLASLLGLVQFVLGGGLSTGRVGDLYGAFSVFSYPSTFASVLGLSSAFLIVDERLSREAKGAYLSLFLLTVLLTRSGTGVAIFGVLLAVWVYRRFSIVVPILVILGFVAALPLLTRRGDIWSSLAVRFSIFLGYIDSMPLSMLMFGRGLGWGTDASAFLVHMNLLSGPIVEADSFYTSLLLQTGILGISAFLLFNLRLFSIATKRESYTSRTVMYMIPLVLAVSVTRNTFELYPINWMYWSVVGVYIRSIAKS